MTVHVEAVVTVVVCHMVVTAMVVMIHSWKSMEEVGVRIVVVDGKCPGTTVDVGRTYKVLTLQEIVPLPVAEHIAQVGIASLVVAVVQLIHRSQGAEVVVVDLIDIVCLIFRQVQLIDHLIGQETCFFAGTLCAECICIDTESSDCQ